MIAKRIIGAVVDFSVNAFLDSEALLEEFNCDGLGRRLTVQLEQFGNERRQLLPEAGSGFSISYAFERPDPAARVSSIGEVCGSKMAGKSRGC